MELGATVCLPKNPECGTCPVKRWCATRGEHAIAKRVARKSAAIGYVLAIADKKIALIKRPSATRLMANMWELPEMNTISREKALLTLRHSITTTDYVVKVWRGKAPKGSVQLRVAEAAKLPLTGLTRKILRRLSLLQE
jgi:A/G-specific adenine glycosylase